MTCGILHTQYGFVQTDFQNCYPSNKNVKFCACYYGFSLVLIELNVNIFLSCLSNLTPRQGDIS
jgi:hypothetical protein